MASYIALLRGINVGGRNKVAMADLRELATGLGLSGVTTVLQSGNLVFSAAGKTSGALEKLLEQETSKRLGVAADYIVRSAAELGKVVAANPFPQQAKDDPSHLVVMFLKSAATAKDVQAVEAAIKGRETASGTGKHLYIVYPDGIGDSKLTGALIESKLGGRGTARNWNTVLKLLALTSTAKSE
jgi:uncharacterized protein (DUF1697 family)